MAVEINTKFVESYTLFLTLAFDLTTNTPNSCKIHNAFGGNKGEHHNCLGCNFADSSILISNYLERHEELTDVQQDVTIYIILLYLLVERIEIVFDIVQLPEVYREKHFKVFQQVRKWANFIKHPKSFILTHHPTYDFENSEVVYENEFNVIINDAFVSEFYKGESDPAKQKSKNKELYVKLRNQKDILVMFPDIAHLTKKICYSYNKFIELITENKIYIDILNDDTTFTKYFENS